MTRNSMKHTLGTAAKACGVGRTTIFRAIQSGKISATKDSHGSYAIDPAELHRVYPTVAEKQAAKQALEQSTTGVRTDETAALRAKIEGLEEILNREKETVADLRRRLDQSEAERRDTQGKLTALLTHQPEPRVETPLPVPPIPKSPEKGELWKKLFGRLNGFPEYER